LGRKLEIVIASTNKGKIKEIKEILSLPDLSFYTYEDFVEWPEIPEVGATYEENVLTKAGVLAEWAKRPALADDSGLEVDALGGAPGLHSARYAGPKCSVQANNEKLLRELASIPFEKRTARFRCFIALVDPSRNLTLVTQGVCEGHISFQPVGQGGFGYDPLFIPLGYTKTLAQLSPAEKNAISHRGKALRKLKDLLQVYLSG